MVAFCNDKIKIRTAIFIALFIYILIWFYVLDQIIFIIFNLFLRI